MHLIDVTVVLCPDGSTFHAEGRLTIGQLHAMNTAWKEMQKPERLQDATDRQITGAVAYVRMTPEEYRSIPATNTSHVLGLAAGL